MLLHLSPTISNRMNRRALLTIPFGWLLSSCHPAAVATRPLITLAGRDLSPLQRDFNAGIGQTRVLTLLSPT